MRLNNLSAKMLMTVLVILGSASCKKPVYYNISTSVQPVGSGNIVATPSSESVLEGTSVSFRAEPTGDYIFTGWSGSLSGTDNPATVVASSNLNVVANFQLREYPLSLSVEGEGSILERVVSTKTDYPSGTVVELTATPATGWSFDHWEGDLSGIENPSQITVSAAKSVKAVFSKNKYTYNLKIVGPGAVDEYIIESTKGSFEYNTKLLLKAYPNEGAVFVGWSGDVSGKEQEIELPIDSEKSIVATFSKYYVTDLRYPLPDLKKPWCETKHLYYGVRFPKMMYIEGPEYLRVDYNRDGYVDFITAHENQEGNYESVCPLHFYLGQPDGTFVSDPINDNKHIGKLPRKMMYCDFNNDDYPDITIAGHGAEIPGVDGMYPMILMSNADGTYNELRFPELLGYHHGSSVGDFDNDGDIDFFLLDAFKGNTAFLINDGFGNFTVDNTLTVPGDGMYTCELFDIDQDGFLDLILAGSDIDQKWDGTTSGGQIIWGNGKTFTETNRITYLPPHVSGQELYLDFEFYDLNGDGSLEIIANTTSCGTVYENYGGWGLEVFEKRGDNYINATFDYFKEGENIRQHTPWHAWIDMEDINGHVYLVGDRECCFEFVDGKFVSLLPNPHRAFQHGFSLFSDEFQFSGGLSQNMEACQTDSYSGAECIRWIAELPFHQGVNMTLGAPADLSILRKNEYVLEFWVKTTNPRLNICTQFETSYVDEKNKGYGFVHSCSEVADGSWHKMSAPLSAFYDVGERTGCDWKDMEFFNIWVVSEDTVGEEFYLDEIRIRKVLPDD